MGGGDSHARAFPGRHRPLKSFLPVVRQFEIATVDHQVALNPLIEEALPS